MSNIFNQFKKKKKKEMTAFQYHIDDTAPYRLPIATAYTHRSIFWLWPQFQTFKTPKLPKKDISLAEREVPP